MFDFPFFISSVIKVLRTHTHTHLHKHIYILRLNSGTIHKVSQIPSHTGALLRFTISNSKKKEGVIGITLA